MSASGSYDTNSDSDAPNSPPFDVNTRFEIIERRINNLQDAYDQLLNAYNNGYQLGRAEVPQANQRPIRPPANPAAGVLNAIRAQELTNFSHLLEFMLNHPDAFRGATDPQERALLLVSQLSTVDPDDPTFRSLLNDLNLHDISNDLVARIYSPQDRHGADNDHQPIVLPSVASSSNSNSVENGQSSFIKHETSKRET